MKATTKIGKYDIGFYTDGTLITSVYVKQNENWELILEMLSLQELVNLTENDIVECLSY
jgi:hypothetical protein